jgi:hypothetical protein
VRRFCEEDMSGLYADVLTGRESASPTSTPRTSKRISSDELALFSTSGVLGVLMYKIPKSERHILEAIIVLLVLRACQCSEVLPILDCL